MSKYAFALVSLVALILVWWLLRAWSAAEEGATWMALLSLAIIVFVFALGRIMYRKQKRM